VVLTIHSGRSGGVKNLLPLPEIHLPNPWLVKPQTSPCWKLSCFIRHRLTEMQQLPVRYRKTEIRFWIMSPPQ